MRRRKGATWHSLTLYDGDELVGEYDTGGAMLKRYVHGIAVDDPVAWYEGSGLASTALRHMIADRQGSIVGVNSGDTILISARFARPLFRAAPLRGEGAGERDFLPFDPLPGRQRAPGPQHSPPESCPSGRR